MTATNIYRKRDRKAPTFGIQFLNIGTLGVTGFDCEDDFNHFWRTLLYCQELLKTCHATRILAFVPRAVKVHTKVQGFKGLYTSRKPLARRLGS